MRELRLGNMPLLARAFHSQVRPLSKSAPGPANLNTSAPTALQECVCSLMCFPSPDWAIQHATEHSAAIALHESLPKRPLRSSASGTPCAVRGGSAVLDVIHLTLAVDRTTRLFALVRPQTLFGIDSFDLKLESSGRNSGNTHALTGSVQ